MHGMTFISGMYLGEVAVQLLQRTLSRRAKRMTYWNGQCGAGTMNPVCRKLYSLNPFRNLFILDEMWRKSARTSRRQYARYDLSAPTNLVFHILHRKTCEKRPAKKKLMKLAKWADAGENIRVVMGDGCASVPY